MKYARLTIYSVIFLISISFVHHAHAATEFVSIVDPGGTGDYSSLYDWEFAVETDLTAATTQVFAGTRDNLTSDNITVYLCTSGNSYRGESARVVHATATQILVDTIASAVAEASTDYWYSNDDCTAGTKYFTLSDGGAEASAVATCRTSSGAADITAVSISGWETSATNYIKIWTDPAEPYRHQGVWDENKYRISSAGWVINQAEDFVMIEGIQIYVDNTGSGYFGGISVNNMSSNGRATIKNNIIRGKPGVSGADENIGMELWNNSAGAIAYVYNNIFYDFNGSNNGYYNGIAAYDSSSNTLYAYNNTVHDCYIGIYNYSGTYVSKNNLSYNNTDNYSGTFDSASTYNITNTSASDGAFGASADTGTTDSTTANKLVDSDQDFSTTVKVGMIIMNTDDTTYTYVTAVDSNSTLSVANDIMPTGKAYTIYTNMYGSPTFEDETNKDFHLDSSDTVAKNKGANLYADGSLAITNDIDNNARPNSATLFDIGADENIAKIYRSVGPSATDAITTGTANNHTNHLTISGITATFELPLPDNVGVGDAIQYDSDNNGSIDAIAFIDKRLSAQKYRIKAASGAAPTAMAVADIDWSIFRAYTSLAKAESVDTNADENDSIADAVENFDNWSSGQDLVTAQKQWNIAAYANGTTADTTTTIIDGWTTSADSYIKIYTPTSINEVGTSQRHSGVWDTGKYRMEIGGNNSGIRIYEENVRIDGLQVYLTSSSESSWRMSIDVRTSGTADIRVSNNILRITPLTGGTWTNAYSSYPSSGACSQKVWNNIIYGANGGATIGIESNPSSTATLEAYNNTIYGYGYGLYSYSGTTFVAKNNIVKGGGYTGPFSVGTDYNATDGTSDIGQGSNNHTEHTFSFVNTNAGSEDFHLLPSDTGAKNLGTDLSNDLNLNFNTDVDSYGISDDTNKTRPYNTTWDIGADEVITPIYRSVAPEADGDLGAIDDDNSQADTLTITTAGAATFEVAVNDIVGVGDALVFDDDTDNDLDSNDTILFIHGRTDSTHYTVKTETGANPSVGTTGNDKWAIYRAYTSLYNAEAGTENTAIPISFTGGNRDIKTNSEQWNFACYANGTTADETAVSISGWTTAPQNYIKIYTPVSTSEVGTSQRHSGVWTTSKYQIDVSNDTDFYINDPFVWIDGLQIRTSSPSADGNTGIDLYHAGTAGVSYEMKISNNIIRGSNSSSYYQKGIRIRDDVSDPYVSIWNNIIYDINASAGNSAVGIGISYSNYANVYNNTVYGAYYGIYMESSGGNGGVVYSKNNISYNNTDNYYGTFDQSSTNNLSSSADAPGLNPINSATVSFVSTTSGSEDFHLASTDTGAKDFGADLSTDPLYPLSSLSPHYTDIDGSSRPLPGSGLSWDIGADEVATPIYRSNSPSATGDLNTDSRTVSISNNTAIFSGAMPDNVGVGDAIQYDSDGDSTVDAVAFITGRVSNTEYTVESSVGAPPISTVVQDLGSPPDDGDTFGYTAAGIWTAYSFTASSSYTMAQIEIALYASFGSPLTSPVTLYLYSDSSNSPGSLIATSTNTHSDSLTSSAVYYDFQFSGVSLTNATRYWVAASPASEDASNAPKWSLKTGGAESVYYSNNGSSWTLDGSGYQGTMRIAANRTANVYRAYTSLFDAEAGIENSGLSDTVQNFDDWTTGGDIDADETGRDIWTNNEQWNIAAYANGTTADTTAVTILGWTTGASNYLKIYTPTEATEVGTSQRHQGKWDDSKFMIKGQDWQNVIYISVSNVKIFGLQVDSTANSGDGIETVYLTQNTEIADNIIRNSVDSGIYLGYTGPNKVYNNIIYNSGAYGIDVFGPDDDSSIYNNTIYNNNAGGIHLFYANNNPIKNNILLNNAGGDFKNDFSTVGSNTANNLTSDGSSPNTGGTDCGGHSCLNQTVKFVDEAGKDFHLDPTDIGARNMGADLSADTNLAVTTDIDGKTRPNQGAFDIGADEAAKGVYYSVGQNVTDHGSGGNMTIDDGIATFTVAQTASNLGVGDKVTYNTSSIAYLLRKVDTTHWYIITATGAIPADDATPRTVNTITHAFNALAEAEDHADDADYMNATDLPANDFQLNIPCYNDAGAADTTAVTVDGYTTGPNNFIKIYTPVDTATEANSRQRHWGKKESDKFRLEVDAPWSAAINVISPYSRFEGLQVKNANSSGYGGIDVAPAQGIDNSQTEIQLSDILSYENAGSSGKGIWAEVGTIVIRNSVFMDNASDGLNVSAYSSPIVNIYNSNSVNNAGYGFQVEGYRTLNCINCYAGGNTGADYSDSSDLGNLNLTTSYSEDGSESTPTAAFSTTAGAYFTNVTAGSEDLHLGASSTLRNIGTNLSTDSVHSFSTDIDGNGRSLWDIGADEGSVEAVASVMQSGGDYSSLSGWQTGMVTDLVSPATMVFAGTKTLDVLDNASVTLYRSGTSQNITATVVHSSATQLLLEDISNPSYVMAASDVWQVDGSNYFTISTAGGDPAIAVAKIDGAWSAPDTSAVNFGGWTTGPTNYVKAYTTAAARHSGKWDENKYRLDGTSGEFIQITSAADVWLDGLQIYTSYYKAVRVHSDDLMTVYNFKFSNNIVRGNTGDGNAGNNWTIDLCYDAPGSKAYVWNNIIYNTTPNGYGFFIYYYYWNTYFYNNTIYGFPVGFVDSGGSSSTEYMKNNIIKADDAFDGTFIDDDAYNDYNSISENTNDPSIGSHGKYNQTFSFVNANQKDFHLASDDTGAKNSGADLASDANLPVTTDIDGSTRPTGSNVVDIGADEAATAVYYSVGQNVTTHETGAGDVTVDATARTATFTVAQTATNMGVGDIIDYDTDNKICYITEKVSTTVWKCQTAIGGAPTDSGGNVVVNSIHHAFASLSDAEDGAPNSSHLNTANLVAGNFVLNIPCYYDTGAETTGLTIYEWDTGPANYIKIYTPNDTTSEVNQSQRHSGKWDDHKYNLITSASYAVLNLIEPFVRVEGLQMQNNYSGSSVGINANSGYYEDIADDIWISNSIFVGGGSSPETGIYIDDISDGVARIWNNILYNWSTTGYNGSIQNDDAGSTAYVYNNTVITSNSGFGIRDGVDNSIVAKNNIAKAGGSDYYGTFASGSDYNASADATAPGTHSRLSQTFSFVDESNKDFHLAFADAGAKGYGANLMNDPYLAFQDDIDGQQRTGNWSIGADEPREAEVQSNTQKVNSITDGLVMYQSFDGGDISGTNAYDRSGNNNNGTITGATTAIGKRGQALSFDGNDKVDLGQINLLHNATAAGVCFWLNYTPASVSSDGAVVSTYSSQPGFMAWVDDVGAGSGRQNTMSFVIKQTNLIDYQIEGSENLISSGKWDYYCVSYSGGNYLRLYKNGALDQERTDSVPASISDNSHVLEFGQQNGGRILNAKVDEVRIYDRALSVDEIGDLYTLGQEKINMSLTNKNTDGLVGMWSFDGADMEWDDTDAEALDRSGSVPANDGDVVGATPTIGKKGQALIFNGTSDYISTPAVSLVSAFSVSFWIKTNTSSTNATPFGWNWFNHCAINSSMGAEFTDKIWCTDGAGGVGSTSEVNDNEWHHIVWTNTGSGQTLYFDGQSQDTDPAGPIPANVGIVFMDDWGGGRSCSGNLDEVRVYDRALTEDEVGDLYRLGQVKLKQ